MTDNELRAHDLAIEVTRMQLSNHKAMILNQTIDPDTGFDIYNIYKAAYDTLLESFNKDFPNN